MSGAVGVVGGLMVFAVAVVSACFRGMDECGQRSRESADDG